MVNVVYNKKMRTYEIFINATRVECIPKRCKKLLDRIVNNIENIYQIGWRDGVQWGMGAYYKAHTIGGGNEYN